MSQFAPASQTTPLAEPPRPDAATLRSFQAAARRDRPTFVQRLGASVGTKLTFGTDFSGRVGLDTNVQRVGEARDPFASGTPIDRINDQQAALLLNGLSPEQASDIGRRARTFEQALDERDRIIARDGLMAVAGAEGPGRLTASIAGGFLDPTYIAVDLAVSLVPGGVASVVANRAARTGAFAQSARMAHVADMLTPSTRRGMIARASIEGGVANAAIEGLLVSQDVSEPEDIIGSAFTGMVLAGAFSAGINGSSVVLGRTRYGKTIQRAREMEERIQAAERAMPDASTDEVAQAIRGSLTPIERQRLSDMVDRDIDAVVGRLRRVFGEDDAVLDEIIRSIAGENELSDPIIRRLVLGDQPDVQPVGRGVQARGPDGEPDGPPRAPRDPPDPDAVTPIPARARGADEPGTVSDPDAPRPADGDPLDPFVDRELPSDEPLPDYDGPEGAILERLGPAFEERGALPRTRFSRVRFGVAAQHGRVPNENVRSVLALFSPDSVVRKGRGGRVAMTDNGLDAVSRTVGFQNRRFADVFRSGLFGSQGADDTIEFLRRSGRDVLAIERDFAEAVTRAMRGENIISANTNVQSIQDTMALIAQAQTLRERGVASPADIAAGRAAPPDMTNAYTRAVQETAENARRTLRNNIVFAARHGVRGAAEAARRTDDFVPAGLSRAGYKDTMRILTQGGLSKARAKQEIVSLVEDAMASGRGVDKSAFTRRMARWFAQQAEQLGSMTDFQFTRFLDGDREAIIEIMEQAGIRVDSAEAQAFLREVGASATPEGVVRTEVPALRPRQPINRAFTRLVNDAGVVISFGDLLEKDVRTLVSRNNAQLIGAGVMQSIVEQARPFFPNRRLRGYEDLRRAMIDELNRSGNGDVAKNLFGDVGEGETFASAAFGTRGTADTFARMIMGLPQTNNPTARKLGRRIALVDTVLNMGKLGFSVVAEGAQPIATNGLRRWFRAVPEAAAYTRDLSLGKKPDDISRVVWEAIGGTNPSAMFGSVSNLDGTFDHKTVVDSVFEVAEASIGALSFGAPMDRIIRFSNVVSAQHLVLDSILTGKVSDVRLRAMRLTRSEFNRMSAAIKADIEAGNIGVERNAAGEAIRYDVPLNMISDADQARKLTLAVQGIANQNIQPNRDPGSLPNFANSEVGRILLRFRTWSISNWERGVLSRLADPDANRIAGGLASVGIGAGIYATLTYNRSTQIRDEKERRKFLQEALSAENVAINAFSRSNIAGIIPSVAATIMGDNVTRNSGLGASFLDLNSVPTVNAATTLGKTINELAKSPFGDPFDQGDLNRARRLVPLNNTVFGDYAFHFLGGAFPEDE